jgi:hypothetical protein
MRAISGQLGDAAKADEEARLGAERAAAEAGRKEADKSSQALLIILIVVLVIILGLIALGPNR